MPRYDFTLAGTVTAPDAKAAEDFVRYAVQSAGDEIVSTIADFVDDNRLATDEEDRQRVIEQYGAENFELLNISPV